MEELDRGLIAEVFYSQSSSSLKSYNISCQQTIFFRQKRPWSLVKDDILSYYIDAYLKKVQSLNQPIWIVDTFAGPGVFGDGSYGSPLIIANTCKRLVPGRHMAIFTNVKQDQHKELSAHLEGYPDAIAYKKRAREILKWLNEHIKKQTLFLYLDPYGLEDCDFDLIKPLLDRTLKHHSTEILLVFQMPYLHRQAARERVLEVYSTLMQQWDNDHTQPKPTHDDAISRLPSEQRNKIYNVDALMGGIYWRIIEYGEGSEEERAERLLAAYMERLAHPDKFAMSCEVNTDYEEITKYHVIFSSRSSDAVVLMNEAMLVSTDRLYKYNVEIKESLSPSLFGVELSPWHQKRNADRVLLQRMIPEYVRRNTPRLKRIDVWFQIMTEHFMRFSQSDYRQFVKDLVGAGTLKIKDMPGKKTTINDKTILYLPNDSM